MSKYRITLDGKVYEMEIELLDGDVSAPQTVDAPRLAQMGKTSSSDVRVIDPSLHTQTHVNNGSVLSPMPGTITAILVGPGEVVSKGQTVLVLEAMKMENDIAAPRDGSVGQLFVEMGQTVQGGEALFEMA